jgi:GNAT superfamily N-acetyltransferase
MSDRLDEVIRAARERHFPMRLSQGIEVRPVEAALAMPFINSRLSTIFGTTSDPLWDSVQQRRDTQWPPLQERYSQLHMEHLLFYNAEDTPIGWFLGETDDILSFYMRNTAFLEPYRGQGIYSSFLTRLLAYLKDLGYERIVSHHRGTNRAVLIPKLRAGFEICGFEVHERYGALVKLVYFLHDDRRAIYYKQYGHTQLQARPEPEA